MSLLEDLRTLGGTLNPDEISDGALVGALIKTLEHEGLTVANDLLAAAAPAAAAAILPAESEVHKLLADALARIDDLEKSKPAAAEAPTAAAAGTPAVAASSSTPSWRNTGFSSTNTEPAAPPIEGAS